MGWSGITAASVLTRVPFETSGITSSSEPVSTTLISALINEAEAVLGPLLAAHDLDPATDATLKAQVAPAILSYALKEVLKRMRHTGETYRVAKRDWDEAKAQWERAPQQLSGYEPVVVSNVDTTTTRPLTFGNMHNEGL